ncbi:MAG TPA: hypothetical protein VFT93_04390, partial [Candidatus Eisenbacteria bacterium]|nr:hypothetical protein [Candidatus Eisenbacteria bacterium]
MSRVARAGRNVSAWLSGLVLVASLAPSAAAQSLGGISGTMSAGFASAYPADWQRTNSFASMQLFNSTQEVVTADIKVTLVRNGAQVAATPAVQRLYPVGGFFVPTPDVTKWQSLQFGGKVGEAVDLTGRLPDGVYTICVDISNVQGTSSGAQYTGFSQCATFVSFFPKPPQLVAPGDGNVVSTPSPVFQWTPVLSNLGGRLPHFFRLVEVYPGQTPERAIEANRALFEQVFGLNMPGGDQSSFSYPAFAPFLLNGHRYAWRVQALLTVGTSGSGGLGTTLAAKPGASFTQFNARPLGENEGRSKVYTFTWSADPMAAAKGAPSDLTPVSDESRMGNVWSPPNNGAVSRSSETGAGLDGQDGDAIAAEPARDGAAEGSNFADRLARVMASLWKQGPGAASAVARAGGKGAMVPPSAPSRGVAMTGSRGGPNAAASRTAPSSSDSRLAAAPDSRLAAAPDSRLAAAPDSRLAAAPDPGSDAQPATPTDAGAAVDSTAQAAVAPPPPPPAAPSSEGPGLGPGWARLHGTASLSGEAYSSDGLATPNRPDRSSRVVTGLSVGVMKDQMRIPVSALFSDDQVAFRQNINQVAVAPRFRWAGVTAGNFSPQFSSYTMADATILGGGLELAPKQWHIGVVSGRARKAITQTSVLGIIPQFERNMTAGRIGYGNPLANSVEFSILHATDDPHSIAGAESTLTLTPEGNTVYSVKAQGLLPTRHLRAVVETALSRYDRDRRADASSVDGRALGLQLFHETGLTRVGVKAEYLNGGFMTLGNSGLTGDRVDVGQNAHVALLQGKVNLDGMAGARNDAVSEALAAETRRRNYGLNGSWQASPRFGADAQMAIYSSESDATDSLFLGNSNTTRVYSVAPHTAWTVGRVQNSFTCSATMQKSENGGAIADTKSLTLLGNWAAQVGTPLSINLSGSYTKTDFEIAVSELSAFGPGFTLAAFRAKLLTNAQLQVTRTRTGNAGTDTDLTPRLEMR